MGLWNSIKKVFDKKCTFCGSRQNVKSVTVLTFLYHYCNKRECREKMDKVRKRQLFYKNYGK